MAEPNTDTTPPTDPKTSTPLTDDEGKAIDDAVAAGKSEECIYLLQARCKRGYKGTKETV